MNKKIAYTIVSICLLLIGFIFYVRSDDCMSSCCGCHGNELLFHFLGILFLIIGYIACLRCVFIVNKSEVKTVFAISDNGKEEVITILSSNSDSKIEDIENRIDDL